METGFEVLEPLALPDELLVIRNPVSANSERAQRQISDLQALMPCSTIDVYPTVHDPVATSAENRRSNQERVLDLLRARVTSDEGKKSKLWLVIATGDGTIRDIGEAVLEADDAIRSVPILPLPAGNGNDFSTMVHGFWGKRRPAQQLHQAHIESVRPLMFTVKCSGEQHKQYALGYLSVGEIIPRAAKAIDQDRGRNRLAQLVNEKLLAVRALAAATKLTVTEQGATRQTSDLIFANGPRMAKFLHWDQRLSDPQFMRSEILSKNLFTLAFLGTKLALGKAPSSIIPDGEAVQLRVESNTMVQLDGEAFWLPAGSEVTVQRSPQSLHVVHLRKANPDRTRRNATKAFAF